jgi:hypothetical protein
MEDLNHLFEEVATAEPVAAAQEVVQAPANTPEPAPEPVPEPPPAPVFPEDPHARIQHLQQKYGYRPPEPLPEKADAEPKTLDFDALFPNGYDPYDPKQAHQMMQLTMSEQLKPFQTHISSIQEQSELESWHKTQSEIDTAISEAYEQAVPGFKDIYLKDNKSFKEQAFANLTENLYREKLSSIFPADRVGSNGQAYNPLWFNAKAQADLAASMTPQLRQLAAELGIVYAPKPAVSKATAKLLSDEMMLEPSSAVNSTSAFGEAFAKGDLTTMFKAIS